MALKWLDRVLTIGVVAVAMTAGAAAQDKSPDRPPEADKARRRDPRADEDRPRPPGDGPRREGDPRPEAGKGPGGPPPMPKGRGGFGGERGFGQGFGGGGEGGGGFGGAQGGYGTRAMPGMSGMGGMGGFSMGGMYGAQPDDPEMRDLNRQDAELERQALELAAQFRRAGGEEREKLKAQVAEIVNKHFAARQERRKLQLKRMEEELKRLREAITKRDDSAESIVKNRISELVGEPRELDF